MYGRADVVTAIDQSALSAMSSYVPEDKLAVVPLAVATPERDEHESTSRAGEPFVLAVGRLEFQKAHDVLIKAFGLVASRLPDWKLVIAGEGRLKSELEQLVLSQGLEGRVIFTGNVTDIYALYRQASIFVMPSRFEGMGNVLLEAMSCGVPPIVSTASPGPLTYVEDGITGITVPVEDEKALAAALTRLAADPGLRAELGRNAADRVRGHSPAEILPVWERLLNIPTTGHS